MRLQSKVMGIGLGAGAMYLLDPAMGKRRRALLRDRLVHLRHAAGETAAKTGRDLRNRARGLGHVAGGMLHRPAVGNEVLRGRVRSRLGRLSTHPSAIEVTCVDGCCTLAGHVLAGERERVVAGVGKVAGVTEVVDQLEAHPLDTDVPALLGEGRLPRYRLLPGNPPPAHGAVAALAGAGLLLLGGSALLRRRRHAGDPSPAEDGDMLPSPEASQAAELGAAATWA